MDVIKSSRFWLALLLIAGAITLAALGKVSGQEALSWGAALLAGFGVAKASGAAPPAAALALLLVLGASGCNSTLAANLERAQLGVMAATAITTTAAHAECSKRALACGALHPPPATCTQKVECQDARDKIVTALIAAADALTAANRAVWSLGIGGAK